MHLDIGNIESIADPTPQDIRHHLRHLPEAAPFLILNGDEELFLQAKPAAGGYRVELRQENVQRFVIVDINQAERLFDAFLAWDSVTIESVPWRRMTWRNDGRISLLILLVTVLIIVAFNLPQLLALLR